MKSFISFGRRWAFDALVLGLSVAGLVQTAGGRHGVATSILATLAPLPLIGRRRFPFGGPTATLALLGTTALVAGPVIEDLLSTFFTATLTAWLIAAYNDRRHAIAGLILLLATLWLVTTRFRDQNVGAYVFNTLFFAAIWLTGFVLNRRIQHTHLLEERALIAETARAEEGLRAGAEERARIARELHDVVGHSVSVMTVQASAVRRLLRPEQEKEREALLTVEQTGRQALAEMRRMVGVLRYSEEAAALTPQPSLEHLDKLINHTREAGLPVELHVEGEEMELPAGVDLTAYRLVQEALTNALKHAGARHAEVRVRYREREVELEIVDDGVGDGGSAAVDGGFGLVGMRERISIYGGELQAGPREDGGYGVRARLPVERA